MKILAVLISIILLVGCVSKITYKDGPTDREELNTWLEDYTDNTYKKNRLKGGISVGLLSRGNVLFTKGVGVANHNNDSTITADTAMPVGSISKIITSVAIMQLVESGSVLLDSAISTYIPDLKLLEQSEDKITVRMLLTQRSGIQGDIIKNFVTRENVDPEEFQREVIGYLNGKPLISKVNNSFIYANAGFALLGIIIENVTDTKYSSYIRKNIFNRAGMSNSLVHPLEEGGQNILGYGKGEALPALLTRDMAAGSIMISSNDMMKFIDGLYSGVLLKEETFKQMVTAQNSGNKIDRSFNIGLTFWLINPLGTDDLIAAHGGDLPPFHSILILFPNRKSAVFVSSNDDAKKGALAMTTGLELAKVLLQYEEETAFDNLVVNKPSTTPATGDLNRFVGSYNTIAGILEISKKKEKLYITMNGLKLPIKLDPSGFWKIDFIDVAGLGTLSLDIFEVENVQYLGLWAGGVYAGASSKVDNISYPKEFDKWSGKYTNSTVNNKGYLIIKDDKTRYIFFTEFVGMKIKLIIDPVNDNKAQVAGNGRFAGDYMTFTEDEKQQIVTYSGVRYIKEK